VNFSTIATLAADSTSFADTGLASGTTYYYRVRALDGSTPSSYSNLASATTDSVLVQPPLAPSNLWARTVSFWRIHLSWSDNSNNETGFVIQRATWLNGRWSSWSRIATVGANVTGFNDNR